MYIILDICPKGRLVCKLQPLNFHCQRFELDHTCSRAHTHSHTPSISAVYTVIHTYIQLYRYLSIHGYIHKGKRKENCICIMYILTFREMI